MRSIFVLMLSCCLVSISFAKDGCTTDNEGATCTCSNTGWSGACVCSKRGACECNCGDH
jgi:hypothetical protein